MSAQKQAKIKDRRISNVYCITVQMVFGPVEIYKYTKINMVGVFAGFLYLYIGYNVVNTFIKYDYSGIKAI